MVEQPVPVPPSFPRFFTSELAADGFLRASSVAPAPVRSVPAIASLASGPLVGPWLRQVADAFTAARRTTAMQADDFLEFSAALQASADVYPDGVV
jgi:hypothetical protein